MQQTVHKRKWTQSFSALRHRNYRWFWVSAIGNSVAMGMQQLTIAWLILNLTDSLSQFGLVLFLQGVPQFIFMFYGGALADRLDKIKLMMGSAIATTTIITIIATLSATGHIQIWHVYFSAVCLGTINAFNTPTRQAIIGSLVPREDLVNAIALNATLMNLARIAGPSATGFIIEAVGISPTLFMNTAFYAFAVLCQLQIGSVKVEARTRKTSVIRDVVDGIKYTKSNAPAWAIVILGFSAGMFTFPTSQIIPAFARKVLTLDASGAGITNDDRYRCPYRKP
ncbi:MAG: MFS transporter [Dehalococcoidia bacterium]|nr:MFS transporter [Dehalococcoidia bacterium]